MAERQARLGVAALAAVALVLAACGTRPPAPPRDAGAGKAGPERVASVAAVALPDDGGKGAGPGSAPVPSLLPAVDRLPPPEVAVAVPTALPGPERLSGMTGTDLAALFGEPVFVRRDPPAEIWQYATDACVLDLFLYKDGPDAPFRVDHFEFRGRTVAGVVPSECYRNLLAARPREPNG